MANPVATYFFITLDPDEDAGRINQNFGALADFAQYEVVHTHHIYIAEFGVSALAAGASEDITVSYPATQFGTSSVPRVVSAQIFSSQTSLTDNSDWGTTSVFNETATSAKVRVRNQSASAFGAGTVFLRVTVVDLNYDTSG